MHLGAVVTDAPSPLGTPRSAAGQAQLRLGKPLRKKCRASPDAFRHAGKSSRRDCWDCPRYSPFSRGARRAGADEGGLRGARKRTRTQCVASQPKQRGTASGTTRSKSRRLTAPNAKSVKIFPREDFGAAVSARLQNSQNSQKPPAGGVPGR